MLVKVLLLLPAMVAIVMPLGIAPPYHDPEPTIIYTQADIIKRGDDASHRSAPLVPTPTLETSLLGGGSCATPGSLAGCDGDYVDPPITTATTVLPTTTTVPVGTEFPRRAGRYSGHFSSSNSADS